MIRALSARVISSAFRASSKSCRAISSSSRIVTSRNIYQIHHGFQSALVSQRFFGGAAAGKGGDSHGDDHDGFSGEGEVCGFFHQLPFLFMNKFFVHTRDVCIYVLAFYGQINRDGA